MGTGGDTPAGGVPGTVGITPASGAAGTGDNTPAAGATGTSGDTPASGAARTSGNTPTSGASRTGDNTPESGAAGTGDNTSEEGAAGTSGNTSVAGVARTGGNSLTAVTAGVAGNTRMSAVGAGGTPSGGASIALAADATQLVGQTGQRQGDPMPSRSPHPQRTSLFVDTVLVGSGVLLPMRSHCGRDSVARHLVVICQVTVLNNHMGDENGFVVAPGHGTATVPLTCGTAAQSGRKLLWQASCIG